MLFAPWSIGATAQGLSGKRGTVTVVSLRVSGMWVPSGERMKPIHVAFFPCITQPQKIIPVQCICQGKARGILN